MATSAASTPAHRGGTTLREQQKEFTRRRLVDAAVAVFERDGYVTSRVEDIAAVAGASRATFYLHFRSKLDVVRELMGPLRADSERLYRQLGATADLSREDLYEWMSRVTAYWHRNRAAITVVNQAIAVEPELAGYLIDSAQASAGAMTGYRARRTGREQRAARHRITLFILQLERVCFFWIIRGVPFDREITLAALTDSLEVALYPGRRRPPRARPREGPAEAEAPARGHRPRKP